MPCTVSQTEHTETRQSRSRVGLTAGEAVNALLVLRGGSRDARRKLNLVGLGRGLRVRVAGLYTKHTTGLVAARDSAASPKVSAWLGAACAEAAQLVARSTREAAVGNIATA